ncbi:molecular chaperone DnaJ [Sandaracinobacter sp. RS1-74]|uniref:molecular chaperone DnaJ n=1 Tax=Sandaracinobacteroides sayramensis TaxID=2913411 RepID=UPI001EDAF876|nr:molecular chaperone DnaJ [Sandaracinobacteroides sayramensis]MCG2839644.1 molecular chaperone DnaJ [Sandaracinobacteroides sayramensis]
MYTEVDYYELLEVQKGCDDSTLKTAYRKLAMRWHPDKNPGDSDAEARFKAISEAYGVLSDPQKRATYDRLGHAGVRGGAGNGAGGNPFGDGAPFSDIFSDIFDQFMGGGAARGRRSGPQRGADLRYDLQVSFEDAFQGGEADVDLDVAVTCDHCVGTGGKPGSRAQACSTCGGRGQVRMQNGMFIVERTCPQCHGSGSVISDPCEHCHGEGRVERRKTLKVKIPKGVDSGTRIRLAGEGEAGPRGGEAGDLYIFIHMKPHPIWKRDGTTLFAQVPMSFVDAALGGEIHIPGLDKLPVDVKVPAGTQSGRQFRVRGRGMPTLNGHGAGDLVVQVELETPTKLSARQKELLEEFRGTSGHEACPKAKGFFDRLKGAWDELTD